MRIHCLIGLLVGACWATGIGVVNHCAWGDSIVNGGFETGDFSGWTQGGNTVATNVTSLADAGNSGAHGGTYYAKLGPRFNMGELSQSVSLAPGQTYEFSFWASNSGNNGFGVFIDAINFFAEFDGATLLHTGFSGDQDWTHYSYLVTPTGSTATVRFRFNNDPSYTGLDDVSLTPAAAPVPLPRAASAGMVLIGSIAVGGLLRRTAIRQLRGDKTGELGELGELRFIP